MKTFKTFCEDVAVNNVGDGKVAGVGVGPEGTPPVRNKKPKLVRRQDGKQCP